MTVPNSLVVMVPSPSLSNREKASLNSTDAKKELSVEKQASRQSRLLTIRSAKKNKNFKELPASKTEGIGLGSLGVGGLSSEKRA